MPHPKRKILFIVLAALVVLVLAVRLLIVWQGGRAVRAAAAIFSVEVWPLDLWSHALNDVEPRRNAAHWAQAGGGALALAGDELGALRRLERRRAEEWTAEDREAVTAMVEVNEDALDLLHRMADLPDSTFDLDFHAGLEMPLPNMLEMLNGGRLLLAETRLALLDERPEDAALAVTSLMSLTRTCQRESPLILQLIGLALERFTWLGAEELVGHRAGNEALFAELRQAFPAAGLAEQVRRTVGFEGGLLRLDQRRPYFLNDLERARGLRYYVTVARLFRETSCAELFEAHGAELSKPKSQLVVDWSAAVEKFKAVEALRELAAVALDVHREGRENGSYPADLSAFSEAGTNAYTGRPLNYRRESDGSVVISVPGAVELWQSLNAPGRAQKHPRFVWRLPPVSDL